MIQQITATSPVMLFHSWPESLKVWTIGFLQTRKWRLLTFLHGSKPLTRNKISGNSQWQKYFSELKISNPEFHYAKLIGVRRSSRQNGRKMTSFRGAMAKLGAGVDNELGGSAPHQCR